MAARSKEIATRSLADLGLDAGDGRRRGRDDDASSDSRQPPAARPRRGSSARPAAEAAREVVDFLAERRLI